MTFVSGSLRPSVGLQPQAWPDGSRRAVGSELYIADTADTAVRAGLPMSSIAVGAGLPSASTAVG